MASSFGSPAPIFRVANLASSFAYYTETLGFKKDWGDSGLVSVSRGNCTIFLTIWDQGNRGTWVWIGVEDAGKVHEELVARGARIRFPPTNYEWAFEMQLEDLDATSCESDQNRRTACRLAISSTPQESAGRWHSPAYCFGSRPSDGCLRLPSP